MPVTPYTRQYDFRDFETVSPTAPKPATALEAEFDAIKVTTDNMQSRAVLIQRDDGKLANASVHPDALDPAAFAALAAEVTDVAAAELQGYVDDAAGSATQAQIWAGVSEANMQDAQDFRDQAAASATAAGTSATNAGNSATAAANSATATSDSELSAANSAVAAEDWSAYAQSWANAANGVEVEPGLYSARHWANQAASAATGAMLYMGVHSAAGGLYPTGSNPGQYWKISGAGTMGGVTYDVGDAIIYNGVGFDKLDNTENVTAVAGRTGAVVLTYLDIGGLGALATKGQVAWATEISGMPATFTPSAHNQDANTITTGTMATARLGSGTASAATVLRGDQTYAAGVLGNWSASAVSTETRSVNIGDNRNNNGISSVEFMTDATSVYTMRVVRNAGANGTGYIVQKGTGSLGLYTENAAAITFTTNAVQRAYFDGTGLLVCSYGLTVNGGTASFANAGIGFGSVVATGTDLSSHINLHGSANYGFNVQTGTLGYHCGTAGKHSMYVNGVEWFRVDAAATYFKNANSTTMTRQPRTFVQSADPGAAAADGDLWFW
jgi:hypothetical protein